jgi:hypothetical protein
MRLNYRKATNASQDENYGREDGKRQTKQRDLELESQRKTKAAVRRGA